MSDEQPKCVMVAAPCEEDEPQTVPAMGLSRDEIIDLDDTNVELVSVPEWGGHVYVRVISGVERDQFEREQVARKGKGTDLDNLRARMAALVISDEHGNRLFTDADAELLAKKSGAALNRIFEVATKLNGWTEADVKDMVKN